MRDLNNSYSSRHHLDYLSECSKDHLTGKGRLHLKVNIIGSDHKELDQDIDTVLKNAESDILTLIADHILQTSRGHLPQGGKHPQAENGDPGCQTTRPRETAIQQGRGLHRAESPNQDPGTGNHQTEETHLPQP